MINSPTMTLRNADACAAYLAPMADRSPIRLPTRALAATPTQSGQFYQLLRQIGYSHRCQKGLYSILHGMISDTSDNESKGSLWSVVIMTDCAAKGKAPKRPAARATISNAALARNEQMTYRYGWLIQTI